MNFQIVSELRSESGPSQPEVDPIVDEQAIRDIGSLSCSRSDCWVQCSVEKKNVSVQEKPLLKCMQVSKR